MFRYPRPWQLGGLLILMAGCSGVPILGPLARQVEPGDTNPGKLTLERLFSDPDLSGRVPESLAFSPQGDRLTYLKASERDSEILDLWALDVATGQARPLVRSADLMDGPKAISAEELARNERLRVKHKGITEYLWSARGQELLFPLQGDLFLYSLATAKVRRLTDSPEAEMDPKLSPGSTMVSFVRQGDLWAVDLASGEARQLTTGATETLTHGLAEFIAQEEMDRFTGYWWSPDEARLAYLEVDESKVKVRPRPLIYPDRTETVMQRYPAAGEDNASVRVKILELASGATVEVDLGPQRDIYIPRVDWLPHGRSLAVQVQSRDQRSLRMLLADPQTGATRQILEETDELWVELHSDLRFLDDGERFLWTSERQGARQIELWDLSGQRIRTLTAGEEPVAAVLDVDPTKGLVYYMAPTRRALEMHLFAVPLEGGEAVAITKEPGWHKVMMSKGCAHYVDSHSRFTQPPRVSLHGADGAFLHQVEENRVKELDQYRLGRPDFVKVKAADGRTDLNGLVVRPVPFDKDHRYPAIIWAYGGPHGHEVRDAWSPNNLWLQFLAHQGFVSFILDNRGTAFRDRAFVRAVAGRLGQVDVEDQREGVLFLKRQPYVRPSSIGLWGWSYGGYLTLMALAGTEDLIAAAAAVAPVTDWRLYDTHYTERYLGLPSSQPEAYRRASVLENLQGLGEPLLLVHGMADDNVLLQHSLALMERLQERGMVFDLMLYPGKAHGIRGKASRLHLFRTIFDYFRRTLRPSKGFLGLGSARG